MSDKRADPSTSELEALFDVPSVPREPGHAGRPRRGRHEKALAKTLRDADLTGRRDAASVSLAHAYAFAMDAAESRGNFYAIAQVGPRYQELLAKLGLIDEGGPRGAGDDDDDVLDGLGAAEMGDSSDA